ncbi:hypothetical protein PENPOL_c016G04195 [Penicillium polonicum]|uniref:Uncharacterized protein n=1 Tax=Penicillium polonicum TaxID=60169 RepID=A0A1V6NAW4_PENPO|nr:hypothetical protein PENPOL_c016G04195 [Penicillium polonicum]
MTLIYGDLMDQARRPHCLLGCSRTLPLDQFRSRFRSGEVKTCQRCRDTDTRSKAKAKAQANTQAQALPRDPQPAPHSDQNKHPFCNEYPFENKRRFQNKHLIPLSPIKTVEASASLQASRLGFLRSGAFAWHHPIHCTHRYLYQVLYNSFSNNKKGHDKKNNNDKSSGQSKNKDSKDNKKQQNKKASKREDNVIFCKTVLL